jgi:hypothetical protein
MATNLVSLVMQFLTPDMIGRIASALGLAVMGLIAGRKLKRSTAPP